MKENDLVTEEVTYKGAVSARNLATLVLGKAKIEYGVADVNMKYQTAKKSIFDWKKDRHESHLARLDSKLNTTNWKPTDEQVDDILDMFAAVTSGQLGLSTFKAVGKVLLNTAIPAKYRNNLTEGLDGFYKDYHHEAVEDLKTSVKDGSAAVSTAASATAKAGAEAVDANVDLIQANVTKAYVDRKAQDAADKKEAADKAAIDAAIALEDYQHLAAAYGPDSENVTKAYAAWQDAEIKARAANEAAGDAADEVIAAKAAYEAAKRAADEKNGSNSGSDSGQASGNNPQVSPQNGGNSGSANAAAASGSGYAAASSTSKANTGDNSKTLVWLTTLATAGIALAKGLVSRLKTQN